MKKVISIIMALIFTLGLAGIAAQAATSDAALTLSYSGSAKAGEIITLNINLSDKAYLSALMFDLYYSEDELELLELKENQTVIDGVSEINADEQGKASVSAFTLDSWNTGGVAFTAKFKILKAGAEVNLEITEACLGDFDGTDVTKSVAANSDKKITFSENGGSVNDAAKSDEVQADKTENSVHGSDDKNILDGSEKNVSESIESTDTSIAENSMDSGVDSTNIIILVIVVAALVIAAAAVYVITRKKKVS